jgi:hypothetical protein
MTALLAQRRIDMSAVQSVDDLAQMEQIAEPGEIMGAIIGIVQRRSRGRLHVPVGPLRWNQRATAIWQSHENEKDAAPPYTADRRQCPAFKGMMLAGNDHRVGNIAVMGSLWPPPSTKLAKIG